jgi:hypothetical protein
MARQYLSSAKRAFWRAASETPERAAKAFLDGDSIAKFADPRLIFWPAKPIKTRDPVFFRPSAL